MKTNEQTPSATAKPLAPVTGSVMCWNCDHWEMEDDRPRRGYCPVFSKNTFHNSGTRCTAFVNTFQKNDGPGNVSHQVTGGESQIQDAAQPFVEEDGEDVFTPMPEFCTKFPCSVRYHRLENRNGFMVCPWCKGSYGKAPNEKALPPGDTK